jgi:hypothetical protein
MKNAKLQLRGNSSVCAGAFQLLRGRTPAHLKGNTELEYIRAPKTLLPAPIDWMLPGIESEAPR